MKVDHKYKNDINVKYLDMALRSCGMGMDYKHADLIIEVQKVLNEKGGDFSLMDAAEVQTAWEEKWAKYEVEKAQNPRTAGRDLKE